MDKSFRLLTPPILNLHDVSNPNNIQQIELKKVKECVVTYDPLLLAVLSDTRETGPHSHWSTKKGGSVITVPLSTDLLLHWVVDGNCNRPSQGGPC
ncbi:hypothetical protein AVEN_143147-1 [Araneus ventricosus]|uniref:Uncharacterized protein n=1 Tax=Araneus ventricosus TaxID=182803 RepID=A0A4Y2C1W5_ARAVE|nr:hypothetical protein AVEN_84622-1 [Araneus ventricosus]GBN80749.1 hypothetical protein AVEN_275169-1 [Araneus ventricosus]GBN80755.1 hypothetical protein AVEN_143147-1 [Araneus ventricosus]